MRRFPRLMLIAAVLATTAHAQTPAQHAPQPNAQPSVQAGTQPVVVDVVAQDKDGHPVHGLKPGNFRLTEDQVPQTIGHVEEHTALAPVQQARELPPMPPGTFTNYTPVAPDGTLNILLIDALNTPTKDQSFLRDQLQQYVKQANPGTRIAIFGLANSLVLLQGFTSDPATLKNVVEHKLIPRSSSPLDTPAGSAGQQNLSNPAATSSAPSTAQLAANLQQFEAQAANLETPLRVQFTLDALNTLGHYLAAFPGRKNLIWFSGSFPLNILPAPSLPAPFAVAQVDKEEFRETTDLLSKARVAVYPIDARGMLTQPTHDASSNKSDTSQAAEHATMDKLASATGGRAFYNTGNLAEAVTQAIDAGADYYTLTYSPANRNEDGKYRAIGISLAGAQTVPGLQLSYRRGYYAADAGHPPQDSDTATASVDTAGIQAATAAYVRAAMSRGAPTPQDLLFKVRVLPASTTTESAAAPDNTLDASVSPKGPFRRYDLDYVAFPSELTLSLQPDGRRAGKVEFLVYVFDTDGRLLNTTGKALILNLTPSTYARLIHSVIECHLEVSVPTSTTTFLRIGVRDVPSNRFGVAEVPTDSVSDLAPPVYPKEPAPTKPATTPAPAPSTPPAPGF